MGLRHYAKTARLPENLSNVTLQNRFYSEGFSVGKLGEEG